METQTALDVAPVAAVGERTTLLVAMTPEQTVLAHRDVLAWCRARVEETEQEADLQAQNVATAKRLKHRHQPFLAAEGRLRKRAEFYRKIASAVEQGYMLVPNLPLTVFAVRRDTSRSPSGRPTTYKWQGFQQSGGALPEGSGEWVGSQVVETSYQVTEGEKVVRYYAPEDYGAIEFPVSLVHPSSLKALEKAQEDMIFDELGLVVNNQSASGDPILCGRILDKTRSGGSHAATFFISWFLDLRTL